MATKQINQLTAATAIEDTDSIPLQTLGGVTKKFTPAELKADLDGRYQQFGKVIWESEGGNGEENAFIENTSLNRGSWFEVEHNLAYHLKTHPSQAFDNRTKTRFYLPNVIDTIYVDIPILLQDSNEMNATIGELRWTVDTGQLKVSLPYPEYETYVCAIFKITRYEV